MKIVIGATGASGSIYLQRLLEQINATEHEVHLVMTLHARQVADHELLTFRVPPKVLQHADNDMNVPFVSGSARLTQWSSSPAPCRRLAESPPVRARVRCCAPLMFS